MNTLYAANRKTRGHIELSQRALIYVFYYELYTKTNDFDFIMNI